MASLAIYMLHLFLYSEFKKATYIGVVALILWYLFYWT